MSNQLILHPAFIGLSGKQTTITTWLSNAKFTIAAATGSGGIAIPFIFDGTGVRTLDVRIRGGSQAGTLHAEIQSPSATPDVANVSGLPDGTAITNGTAGTAAVTGGIEEVLTLTWATAPTPTGFHWLILEGSSGGTIDIEIGYVIDYSTYNLPFQSIVRTIFHDGVDWNNGVNLGAAGVVLRDAAGDALAASCDRYPPYLDTAATLTTPISADNKECIGVEFTAKDNLTELAGVMVALNTFGPDMNFQFIIAKTDGTVVGTSSVFNEQSMMENNDQTYFPFDNTITLVGGTSYRWFLFNPGDTTDDVWMHYWDLAAASDQSKAWMLDSGEFALCTATDPPEAGFGGSGVWATDDTRMPWVQLVFKLDVTAISGGGGGQYSWA